MTIKKWFALVCTFAVLVYPVLSAAVFAVEKDASPVKIVVIGNKDTRRYHLPGMPYYNKVAKYHRVYFNSEQEAIDNGYYKAGTIRDAPLSTVRKSQPVKEQMPALETRTTEGPEKKTEAPVSSSAPLSPSTDQANPSEPPKETQAMTAAAALTLDESIQVALKNSLTIHSAKEGVAGAKAQKQEAMTGFFPKFSTSYSYTRLNEEPSFYFPGFPPLIPAGDIITGTINNYSWVIEARQSLFAGGGILANYQANRIGEEAARVEETARTQDVVQEVKIAYFNILRMQRLLDTSRRSVEMLNAHADVAQNFFRVGLIPKNDMLQAEVELANGRQALIRAQNAVELAKSRFNTALKRDLGSPVDVVDILNYRPFKKSFPECLDIARQHRPELKLSKLRADQAGKMVRVAQSEYFPSVGLVGNYTRYGDQPSVSGSDYKDMESWQVMAVASWNFWEWGKTKYRVDSSRARENQALDQTRELSDQMALEIKNAYIILQEAESQIAVSQKVIDQAEENFRIAEARYKERVARSTEVLDAQTLLTRAKSEYANALGDYYVSLARLQRAMGVTD